MGLASQGNPDRGDEGMLTAHSRALCRRTQSVCPTVRLHGEGMIQVVTDFEYQGKRCVYTAGDFRMTLNTFIDLTNSLIYTKSMLI